MLLWGEAAGQHHILALGHGDGAGVSCHVEQSWEKHTEEEGRAVSLLWHLSSGTADAARRCSCAARPGHRAGSVPVVPGQTRRYGELGEGPCPAARAVGWGQATTPLSASLSCPVLPGEFFKRLVLKGTSDAHV